MSNDSVSAKGMCWPGPRPKITGKLLRGKLPLGASEHPVNFLVLRTGELLRTPLLGTSVTYAPQERRASKRGTIPWQEAGFD